MKSNHGVALFIMNVFLCVMFMIVNCYGADSIKEDDSKKFDVIEFGGHNWFVLDLQDDKALILTEKVIERREYHHQETFTHATWSECDLRKYLNTEFLETFSAEDRERILDTKVVTNDNQWFDKKGGEGTVDKVFLLSLEEVVKYFGDSGQLKNIVKDNTNAIDVYFIRDQYNKSRIAYDKEGRASLWWLRSPGSYANFPAHVYFDGGIYVGGGNVVGFIGGSSVRPALWLKIE